LLDWNEGRKQASRQGTNSLEESILFEEEEALRGISSGKAKLGLLGHL
jgi:hypothetical protein